MIQHRKKWKPISYERYQKLTRGKDKIDILFLDNVTKGLKENSFLDETKGGGILEFIRLQENRPKKKYTTEDYNYYEEDGYEWVIIGGAKALEAWRSFFKNNSLFEK